jgi:hypothetical protein
MNFNKGLGIVALVIALLVAGFLSFSFFGSKEKGNDNLAAVNISQNEEEIMPEFTDENTGETVIIKSDQENYTGDLGIESYFSVQNTSQTGENFDIQFYFPKNVGVDVEKVEIKTPSGWENVGSLQTAATRPEKYKITKPIPTEFGAKDRFKIPISSGETKYFRTKIVFDENAEGEFWIEAIGDRDGYGLLDPTFSHVNIRGGGAGGGGVRLRGGPAGTVSQTPAFVQSKSNNAFGNPTTVTFDSNVVAGNVIVGQAFVSADTSTITGVTDNCGTAGGASNTYTLFDNTQTPSNGPAVSFVAVIGASKSCTVTIANTGGNWQTAIVQEVSGVDNTTPVGSGQHAVNDQASPGTGTNAVTSGNITTTRNNAYIFSASTEYAASGLTYSAGTNYTARAGDTTGPYHSLSESRVQSSAGSIAATFTINTNSNTITHIVALQPASAATSGNIKFR